MELEELKEKLCDEGFEDAVVFENPDYASAAIGTTEDGCVVYSYPLMVKHLMDVDGMTEEDAVEFIDYNTIRSIPYAGDKKPVVLYPFRED